MWYACLPSGCSSSPAGSQVIVWLGVQPERAEENTYIAANVPSTCCAQVVPTVTVLAMMKARLTGAVKGHALLKKKADALTLRCACVRLCCLSSRAHRVFAATLGRTFPRAGLRQKGAAHALYYQAALCARRGESLALLPTRCCWARAQVPPDLKKIVETKQEMGRTMRAGAFALTEAKYAAGEFATTVLDSVESVRVPLTVDQCMLPIRVSGSAQQGGLYLVSYLAIQRMIFGVSRTCTAGVHS